MAFCGACSSRQKQAENERERCAQNSAGNSCLFVCSLARLLARRWWWWSLRPRTMSSGLRMPNCTTCTLRVGAEEYFSVAMVDTARSGRRSGALAVCVAACYARGTTNETNAHTQAKTRGAATSARSLYLALERECAGGRCRSGYVGDILVRSLSLSLSCLRARLQAARQLNRANALRLCCGCCCLRAREEERQSAEAGAKYPSCPGGPADYHGNVGTELRVRYAAPASPALPRFVGLFARRPPLLLRTERAASVCRRCLVGWLVLRCSWRWWL